MTPSDLCSKFSNTETLLNKIISSSKSRLGKRKLTYFIETKLRNKIIDIRSKSPPVKLAEDDQILK